MQPGMQRLRLGRCPTLHTALVFDGRVVASRAACGAFRPLPNCTSELLPSALPPSQGFDNVNNILSSNGAYAPGLLIQIVVMKVIATSICRGSGLQASTAHAWNSQRRKRSGSSCRTTCKF